jgi:dihydrofolate reductase
MRQIIAFISLTLDGVMQAPGRADEDTRGGFQHGGWAVPYQAMASGGELMMSSDALLFGRRTYEDFYGFWPHQGDNFFTGVLNNMQKYVASNTLTEPLAWQNSTLLNGELAAKLREIKAGPGKDIVILGSGDLIQNLMPHGLVDRYVLMIYPLVLGSGRRLFPEGGIPATLKLTDTKSTDTGVIVATYERAG